MKHKFTKNNKYYTISIYVIATVLIATIGIKVITNWQGTISLFENVIGVLTPFLVGFFIAYIINPLSKLINQKILKPIFRGKSLKLRKVISVFVSYIIDKF